MRKKYCEIGAFVGNPNHRPPTAKEIHAYEHLIGRHINSLLFFWDWDDGAFPKSELHQARYHDGYDTKISLHLTWEPWKRAGVKDKSFSLASIIKGKHDAYIQQFARDCREWKSIIRLRFAHEMIHFNNPKTSGWYPWQDNPAEYVQAWRHIHTIFKKEKADNVEFVWAVMNYPTWLDVIPLYYPGKEYVDWLAIDGYNWGEDGKPGWPYDQNFNDLFYPMYHTFLDHPEIFGNKKIMISEIATPKDNRFGGNKSIWIIDMFKCLKSQYSKVQAFYWFNAKKEKDWRVNSSPLSLAAYRKSLRDPYFTSHAEHKL